MRAIAFTWGVVVLLVLRPLVLMADASGNQFSVPREDMDAAGALVDPLIQMADPDDVPPEGLMPDQADEWFRKRDAEKIRLEAAIRDGSNLTRPLLAMAAEGSLHKAPHTGLVLRLLSLRNDLQPADLDFVRGLMENSMTQTERGKITGEVFGGCMVLAAYPSRGDQALALRVLDWQTTNWGPEPGRRDPTIDAVAAKLLAKIGGEESIEPLRRATRHWEAVSAASDDEKSYPHKVASILADALKAVQTRVSSKVEPTRSKGTDTRSPTTGPHTNEADGHVFNHTSSAEKPWLLSALALIFLVASGWWLRSWRNRHER